MTDRYLKYFPEQDAFLELVTAVLSISEGLDAEVIQTSMVCGEM